MLEALPKHLTSTNATKGADTASIKINRGG
jgi:hypothetical protein